MINHSPDDKNPRYMFQLTDSSILVKALRGEIDLLKLAEKELTNRGFDSGGNWKGFLVKK